VGAADPAYRVTAASPGAFSAYSPAQRLHVGFERSGVVVAAQAARVGLTLGAIGYGSSLAPVPAATPRASRNRVTYSRGALQEWYANGPLGLEQGFTLQRAPAGRQAGPLTLSIALSGEAHPSLAPGGQSILLAAGADPTLRYGELKASDARGRTLPSRLELHGRTVLLSVDTRGARFPVRIDPLVQQGEALDPAEGLGPECEKAKPESASICLFGIAVALSGDDKTALIGARGRVGASGQPPTGDAWIFTRTGETWDEAPEMPLTVTENLPTEETECTEEAPEEKGEEGGSCGFGRSVALSADGKVALIGAPRDNERRGAAWIFTRSGEKWSKHTKLTAKLKSSEHPEGETAEGFFGRGVALSANGSTALIGGSADNAHRGAAWVFTRSGETWTQEGEKLTGGTGGASEEEQGEGYFGHSVALSGAGTTALIGASGDASYAGAAWVFVKGATAWERQLKLVGGSEEVGEGRFGYSVALSGDGNTALIGARSDNADKGAAWVFTNAEPGWVEQHPKLTVGTAEGEKGQFGYSVALSRDGHTALIGAPKDGHAGNLDVGSAWLFRNSGSGWPETGERLEPLEEAGRGTFGTSVALSEDGEGMLVGSAGNNIRTGSAWGFEIYHQPPPTVTKVTPSSGPERGGTEVTITGTGFPTQGKGLPPTVIIGSEAEVISTSPTKIKAKTRAHSAGEDEVVVSDETGSSAGVGTPPDFTYLPPPTVTNVNPSSGPEGGGTEVTITGTGFIERANANEVKIGTVAAKVKFISSTELKATTAATVAGVYEVVASNEDGSSEHLGTPPSFTYQAPPAPVVETIKPSSGPEGGGTEVTIDGNNFVPNPDTTVEFGSVFAKVLRVTKTEIKVTTNAEAAGKYHVVVSGDDGSSPASGGPSFTYEPEPITNSPLGQGGSNVGAPAGSSGSLGVLGSITTQPPTPEAGVSGNLAPVSGIVLVKLPGSKGSILLTGVINVPFGTIIDAIDGSVTLTTVGPGGKLQTITFSEGEFKLTQTKTGQVVATLYGGNFGVCPTPLERGHRASVASHHASGHHVVRKLWSSGHGSYSTQGNYASGAVLGTKWLTEDLCEGTLIRVVTDKVLVTNFVNHHHFIVKAGHSYLVKA